MQNYLAQYTFYFHSSDGMPCREPEKPEYRFKANSTEEARKLAEEHKTDICRGHFGPSVTLDKLLEIKEIKL